MKEPTIEWVEVDFNQAKRFSLYVPYHYIVTDKHPRWRVTWWMLKLAWKVWKELP